VPDVRSGAVAFDEGNDGVVGDDPMVVPEVDFGSDSTAAAAFYLGWHGPHSTTKRPAFGGRAVSYQPSAISQTILTADG
jgi:hypothetical protein